MAELTDEAVRNLNQILQQMAQQEARAPRPTPAATPGPPPGTPGEAQEVYDKTEKAIGQLNAAMHALDEEAKKTSQSFIELHESIDKSFSEDEMDAKIAKLQAETEALQARSHAERQYANDLRDSSVTDSEAKARLKVAYDEYTAAMKRAAKQAKDTKEKLGAERGLTKELDKIFASMTGGGIKTGGLMDKMRGLQKGFKASATAGGGFGKVMGRFAKGAVLGRLATGFSALIEGTIDLVKAQDKAISSFRKATGAGKEYNLEITKLERNNRFAGVTADKAGKAYNTLFDNFSAFTQLNKSERNQVAKTTTLLGELGVSGADTAKIFDQMTRSLGMGIGETNDVVLRLAGTAKSLGVSMAKMSKDFGAAFKELSKYGKGAIDVFEGLAKQSKATGLAVSTLMGLAKQFDTFDSAAKSVGRLNAIMGGPYLNSIDMLNATEAERIDLLKASVDAAGIQFDAMGRFEKQAIASAMGMSVEDASRIMGMNTAEMELQALQQEELAELAQNSQEIMAQIKNAFASMLVDMRPFIENFIVPMVEALGKFGQWLGNAENGLSRFIKMGMLAAGIAALIGAPFTGGASLITYAAIIGAGGLAAYAGGGGGEEGAAGATDEVSTSFHASGGVVRRKANGGSLWDRAKTAVGINESGAERIVVPYGTYVSTAADTKRSNDLASELIKEVQGLRADLTRGSDQPAKIVIEDTEFAATIVNNSGIGPFGAISRMV